MKLTREDIERSPGVTFIYSSTVHREVPHGQASVCIGNPNCFRVPVRWSLCKSSGYFSDSQMRDIKIEIDVAISKIPLDKPLYVLGRIGEGASRMSEFAPNSWKYLMDSIYMLEANYINSK